MSAAAAGVVRIDVARARALTRQLQRALDVAVELVRELHESEAWRVLGHDSWPAYCAAELPQLRVIVRGMPKEERRAKVAELRGAGMSLRDVSEVTGLAPNTVRADAAAAGVQLVTVKSRDGALRPARVSGIPASSASSASSAPARPLTDRLVQLLRAAGPDGATVLELCDRARVRQARVAPALCRLAAAGRVEYRRPERRGQLGRYVAGRIA